MRAFDPKLTSTGSKFRSAAVALASAGADGCKPCDTIADEAIE
jgi:hypothetical protein